MVVEAAVIQIDGAHHGLTVIHHKDLGVNKARHPLRNFDARADEGRIVGLGQRVRNALVRLARQDEVDIHAPLRRKLEGCFQLPVQNQVGRHDVDVLPGPVEQVDINQLAHPFPVQRAIAVRGRKALGPRRGRDGLLEVSFKLRLPGDIPHLQKDGRQRADRLALQHDSGIFPAAKLLHMVDVLVGQIHAARKAHFAVNDQHFSVVSVIIMGRDKGHQRRENFAGDAQPLQPLGVVPGQGGELTGAVVHHPHMDTLSGLTGQHFQHPAPHEPLVNDEILQENILFRFFQLAQQLRELGLAAGKIGHSRVLIHREAAAFPPQVVGQRGRTRLLCFQPFQRLGILGQLLPGILFQLLEAALEHPVADFAFGPPEQHHAQDRHQRNDHQPGDLGTVVHIAVEQVDDHNGRERDAAAQQMGHQRGEPPEHAEQQQHLHKKEGQHQSGAAKNGPDDAPFALFQQPDAAILKNADPVFDILFELFWFHSVPFIPGLFPFQRHRKHSLCRMAILHQRLGLGADAMVVPWVIEPVVLVVIAHQQQAVLVAFPCKIRAVGQQPVVPLLRHRGEIQRGPEDHRHPGVKVLAELSRRLARLIHYFKGVRRPLVIQRALQCLDDAGGIAAIAGVVVGVAGVDFIGIRAVEFSIIIPVGRVGQVPLNERVRVNGNAHRLQQHHRANALAAVHPAFRLVDIGSRYDFFHQNSFRGANGLCQKQPKCGIIATNR